jgi:hypothetical protein
LHIVRILGGIVVDFLLDLFNQLLDVGLWQAAHPARNIMLADSPCFGRTSYAPLAMQQPARLCWLAGLFRELSSVFPINT